MGPLGNGYTLKKNKAILVAGGIGVPPMLELAKELDCEKTIVLGYRDELFLNKEFEQYGKVVIATEDGSCGTKGNVLEAIRAEGVEGQVIYSCGPTPMLRALKQYAADNGIEAWISLEEKMACGIGAHALHVSVSQKMWITIQTYIISVSVRMVLSLMHRRWNCNEYKGKSCRS